MAENKNGLGLTERHRRELNEWGFTVFESHFQGEELKELTDGADRLRKTIQASTTISSDGVAAVEEIDGTCLGLIDHPRILPYVVDAMGWNIHARDCLFNFNTPKSGEKNRDRLTLPWHFDQEEELTGITQDGVLPLIELKVSLYLSDHTEDGHACTLIRPGSHRWTPNQRSTWEETLKPMDVVPMRLPIGSMMLWRSSVLHSVAPHTADSHRYHLFVSYVPRWIRPSHRGNFSTSTNPDPAYDKELLKKSSPVRRQLLGAMGDLSPLDTSQYWFPHHAEQLPLKQWVKGQQTEDTPHRWGVTGHGVSFSRVLFNAQALSLDERIKEARAFLDEESPSFQQMKKGMGYRNLMNAKMEDEWNRKNAWKSIPISADGKLPTQVEQLADENQKLKAQVAELKLKNEKLEFERDGAKKQRSE